MSTDGRPGRLSWWLKAERSAGPEQDHRAVKRRIRPMLGFKSLASARAILGGIELIHMMRKGQPKYAYRSQLSLAEQFTILAA
jgi:putative transposase